MGGIRPWGNGPSLTLLSHKILTLIGTFLSVRPILSHARGRRRLLLANISRVAQP